MNDRWPPPLPPVSLVAGAAPIRLGVVSFLNARPLVWALEERPTPQLVLSYDHPAALARQLRAGEIDVGLVPVAEALRNPSWCAIEGLSISSDGPVWSVKLLTETPPRDGEHRLRRIGVDYRSRSSVALLRALLADLDGPVPELVEIDPSTDIAADGRPADARLDGVLVIGDRALDLPEGWDLGAAWRRKTGLPFIYALWMARNRRCAAALGDRLRAARDLGLEHLDRILAHDSAFRGRDEKLMRRYLREAIDYGWSDRHRRAIARFARAIGVDPGSRSVHEGDPRPAPSAAEHGQSITEFILVLVLVSIPVFLSLQAFKMALGEYLRRLAIGVSIPFV